MSNPQLTDFEDHRDEDVYTVVMADCRDCRSIHPLGSRVADPDTPASTGCPSCGSPTYATFTRTYQRGDEL